jgi:hypothetical protein
MAKFKKIKIQGLTELEKLDLNVASSKHYTISGSPEDFSELMAKLTEIASKSPGAIISKPVKGTQHVSAVFRPARKRTTVFAFPEPNPVQLYYDIAVSHLTEADTAKITFQQLAHAPSEEEFNTFCVFFKEIVQGIVFLLMTAEAFMNQLPDEGASYNISGEEKSQQDIEWMTFKDKLRYAVPVLTGYDLYANNRALYDRITLLNDLRDDLIHLKKINLENFTLYQNLFKRLFDFNSQQVSDAVFDFINAVRPGYFQEE